MDIGDIGSLIFFAIIALSFLGRFVGGGDKESDRPSSPRDLRESGGHDPSLPEPVHPQPLVTHTPEGPVYVEIPPSRQESRDRAADKRGPKHIQDAQRRAQERYGTTGVPEVYADRQQRRRRPSPASEVHRRRRIVEGGDVLRRSLKDPATLERGFIVKEVLDVPVGLRRDA